MNERRGLSPEAIAYIQALPKADPAPAPQPDDSAGWARLQSDIENRAAAACAQACKAAKARVGARHCGDLDVVTVATPTTIAEGPPLIYLHGGAYTGFSARSSLFASVPMAHQLKRRLFSVDYLLAPHATVTETVPATADAIGEICADAGNAVLIGDSAGGGLALAAALRLIAEGKAHPVLLILISPWTDLRDRGDSRTIMAPHDPILCPSALAVSANAYAPDNLSDPMASPIEADYPSVFPPTFILGGTRDILLSDALRLHRKMRGAELDTELELVDGLFHSFPAIAPHLPESIAARAAMQAFINRKLVVTDDRRWVLHGKS